jgi:hypothetical protein
LDDAHVVHFLEFNVPAWFGVSVFFLADREWGEEWSCFFSLPEGLFEELVEVADAASHGAHVD